VPFLPKSIVWVCDNIILTILIISLLHSIGINLFVKLICGW
jgi:hypothetical protein